MDEQVRQLKTNYDVLMAALGRKCEQYIALQMQMQKQNDKISVSWALSIVGAVAPSLNTLLPSPCVYRSLREGYLSPRPWWTIAPMRSSKSWYAVVYGINDDACLDISTLTCFVVMWWSNGRQTKRLEASNALCQKLYTSGLYWQKRGQRKDKELKDTREQMDKLLSRCTIWFDCGPSQRRAVGR